MVPLIGYVDRFSARPGERIAVKVSSQSDQPYQTDLVRIIHADANPAGPASSSRRSSPISQAHTYRASSRSTWDRAAWSHSPSRSRYPIPALSSFGYSLGYSTDGRKPSWRLRVDQSCRSLARVPAWG
jgi:hypothetical protein